MEAEAGQVVEGAAGRVEVVEAAEGQRRSVTCTVFVTLPMCEAG